jgi:hypothetical protein
MLFQFFAVFLYTATASPINANRALVGLSLPGLSTSFPQAKSKFSRPFALLAKTYEGDEKRSIEVSLCEPLIF